MKTYPFIPILVLCLVQAGAARGGNSATGWQQEVRYTIHARLDTAEKRLVADMRIFYRNNSPDTLRHIFLQVPANAFHDEENTAVREMRRFSRGNVDFGQQMGAKLTVESVQFLAIGTVREFPLQAYDFSDTILDLALPYPLVPGDSLTLLVTFRQDFGKRVPTQFLHWFPKLAVYDEAGWHAEPFHFMMQASDVFSAFAQMDVSLTVPGDDIVIASGRVVEGDPGWQEVDADTSLAGKAFTAWHDSLMQARRQAARERGPRRVRFVAEHMHDFAWAASRRLVHLQLQEDLPVHLFYRGLGDRHWRRKVERNFNKVWRLLRRHFGEPPFSHVSLVRAGRFDFAQPMLAFVTEGGNFELAYELTAMYFPGLVGTDGVKEAWLANGLQVTMGKAALEMIHGKRGYDLKQVQSEMSWFERRYPLPSLDAWLRSFTLMYNETGQNEPISKAIHKYHDPIGALVNIYAKSELFYEMLRFVVGDSLFQQALRQTVQRYAFTHIDERDLQAVFEDVSGQKLDWFFDEWLHGTPTVDYAKGKVRKVKENDSTWVTEVEVKRKGDGVMPVEVELDLPGEKKLVQRWDGKAETGRVVFRTREKPGKVRIDPRDRILDSNRLNTEKPRLEFRPDWPLLKYIHMPNDAILVLWRPLLDYNDHDSFRLGLRTSSSYRAFYHNVTLEFMFGFGSTELDGKVAYSNPLSHKSLLNRYEIMVRKNEGRFETDAHLDLNGSNGILASSGRSLRVGLNFSALLNSAYTFREVASDTGTFRFDEWDDLDILLAYASGRTFLEHGAFKTELRLRAETALPGGDAQFTKLQSRLVLETKALGLRGRVRGNFATSFGPDRLPRQDQFHGEGAAARERFQNDIVKTGDSLQSFHRRYVEGGGFLRGYAGQPLPAERYTTVNLELGTARPLFLGFKFFGFYDAGRVWTTRSQPSFTRYDAGVGFSLFGSAFKLFGGNLPLGESLSVKVLFPLWLSDPLPGEKHTQFRWYLAIGRAL